MLPQFRLHVSISPWLVFAVLVSPTLSQAMDWNTLNGATPIVIAHRGASGYLPEHTLEAYALSIEQGADFIEPDLVSTQDGQLIARHEPLLAIVDSTTGKLIEETTNVRDFPEFGDRKRTAQIDGKTYTGWFAADFTLEEIKKLRTRERIPQLRHANTEHNDKFQIPTLAEIIELAQRKSQETGRSIGIYPETKHPTYHQSIGLSLEPPLVAVLTRYRLTTSDAPVFIQSFEVANLKSLSLLIDTPLVQLLGGSGAPFDFTTAEDTRTFDDLATPAGLAEIASYAAAIGPPKSRILEVQGDALATEASTLVRDAHQAGLAVHPYTFRAENAFLPNDLRRGDADHAHGDFQAETARFLETGIDGFFTDFPDLGRRAVLP